MLSQPHHQHAGNFHSQAAAWAAPGQHAGPNAAVANCQAAAAQSAPPPGAQQVTSTLDRVLAEDAHAQVIPVAIYLCLLLSMGLKPVHDRWDNYWC